MKIFSLILVIVVVVFISRLLVQNLTSPTHLGHQNGQLAPMPDKPNAVSSQTELTDKLVAPLHYKNSTKETHKAIIETLTYMGNNNIQTNDADYIYTIFTSDILHFHDDVEILLDDEHELVHFRSQSRAGHSDLGVNRARYEIFKAYFDKL